MNNWAGLKQHHRERTEAKLSELKDHIFSACILQSGGSFNTYIKHWPEYYYVALLLYKQIKLQWFAANWVLQQ